MRMQFLVAGGARLRNTNFLCVLLFLAPAAYAQTNTGALRGVVQDLSGARITAATVEITSSDASFKRIV